jgi:hypothetical protein
MKLNPSEHFRRLVHSRALSGRVTFSSAWNAVARENPDAATLMCAYGRTRQQVVFFNSQELQKSARASDADTKQFSQFVNEKTRAGMSYTMAFKATAREHPELLGNPRFVQINKRPSASVGDVSTDSPAMAAKATITRKFQADQKASASAGPDKRLAKFVNEKVKAGWAHGAAYSAAIREHPELGKPQFVNVDDSAARSTMSAPAAGAMPVKSPAMLAIFKLPVNVSQAEFAAAWEGNGNTLSPLNPAKIFAGLCAYWQKEKPLDYDQSIQECKRLYPDLWAFVELLAAQKA